MMNADPQTQTLTAANENPGGPRTVEMALTDFVTVLAKAYVAETRTQERKP
mgnify:FL=1